jgi:hypothetical protein
MSPIANNQQQNIKCQKKIVSLQKFNQNIAYEPTCQKHEKKHTEIAVANSCFGKIRHFQDIQG